MSRLQNTMYKWIAHQSRVCTFTVVTDWVCTLLLCRRVRAELDEAKQKVKNDNEDDVSPWRLLFLLVAFVYKSEQRRMSRYLTCYKYRLSLSKDWSPACRVMCLQHRGSASPGWRWPECWWRGTSTRRDSWSCRRPSDGRRWSGNMITWVHI